MIPEFRKTKILPCAIHVSGRQYRGGGFVCGYAESEGYPLVSLYISVSVDYVQTKAMKKESVMNNLIPAIHF